MGQALDNMMGGNPNPTMGQAYANMQGSGVYGVGYNPASAALQEAVSDQWINQNIPGGVNSKFWMVLFHFRMN